MRRFEQISERGGSRISVGVDAEGAVGGDGGGGDHDGDAEFVVLLVGVVGVDFDDRLAFACGDGALEGDLDFADDGFRIVIAGFGFEQVVLHIGVVAGEADDADAIGAEIGEGDFPRGNGSCGATGTEDETFGLDPARSVRKRNSEGDAALVRFGVFVIDVDPEIPFAGVLAGSVNAEEDFTGFVRLEGIGVLFGDDRLKTATRGGHGGDLERMVADVAEGEIEVVHVAGALGDAPEIEDVLIERERLQLRGSLHAVRCGGGEPGDATQHERDRGDCPEGDFRGGEGSGGCAHREAPVACPWSTEVVEREGKRVPRLGM